MRQGLTKELAFCQIEIERADQNAAVFVPIIWCQAFVLTHAYEF
jgi:hypothetical protein